MPHHGEASKTSTKHCVPERTTLGLGERRRGTNSGSASSTSVSLTHRPGTPPNPITCNNKTHAARFLSCLMNDDMIS